MHRARSTIRWSSAGRRSWFACANRGSRAFNYSRGVAQRRRMRDGPPTFDQDTPILALEIAHPDLRACPTLRASDFSISDAEPADGCNGPSATERTHSERRPVACNAARRSSQTRARGRVVEADGCARRFATLPRMLSCRTRARPYAPHRCRAGRTSAHCSARRDRDRHDFHPDALKRGWKRTFKSGADTVELESDPIQSPNSHTPS